MNMKVEDELVEFKKEIEDKYEASYVNMNYQFKRAISYNNESSTPNAFQPSSTFGQTEDKKKHKKTKSKCTDENVYSTFSDKILMKNLYNYEKVICGDTESGCAKTSHKGEAATFDYNINKHNIGEKNENTFSSECDVDNLLYQYHQSSNQNITEIPVIVDMKKAVKGGKNK